MQMEDLEVRYALHL